MTGSDHACRPVLDPPVVAFPTRKRWSWVLKMSRVDKNSSIKHLKHNYRKDFALAVGAQLAELQTTLAAQGGPSQAFIKS
jgi:hypothetical protein